MPLEKYNFLELSSKEDDLTYFKQHSITFHFGPLVTIWRHFEVPYFNLCDDAIAALACLSKDITCQKVSNRKTSKEKCYD